MKTLLINKEETTRLLPMSECIDVVRDVLKTMAEGVVVNPLRAATWMPDRKGLIGTMPGFVGDPPALAVKVVSVFPNNHDAGYDSHQGAVLLFDTKYGTLQAIADAGEITAIRTAAASAVATAELARKDASKLALIGSGVQATTHLEAISLVRDISEVSVWSRNFEHAQKFAKEQSEARSIKVEAFENGRDVVADADIVCTLTAAREPVLEGEWLKAGAHINAVGACTPKARELDTQAVVKSRLIVDSRESTFGEAGDFLIPLAEKAIGEDHIVAELGEVLVGKVEGRTSEDEVTLYESLGIAIEDVAVLRHIYEKALKEGVGTEFELS